MRSFVAFFKKELLESIRSSKILLLGILFVAFGIMNPAIAKLTPWMLEVMADQLAESGMTVTAVTVDALTSWTQFFKNIPMALMVFVFVYSSIFTKEYESETLVLIFTKGLARYKVLLAKTILTLGLWSAGYWLCFGITYGYNAYFWDNSIAAELMPAVVNWWLFGMFTVALMMVFSVLSRSYLGVLLGTGGVIAASYAAGLVPKAAKYVPTSLMNSAKLLVGAEKASDYAVTLVITVVLTVFCIAVSIPVFNKKQI